MIRFSDISGNPVMDTSTATTVGKVRQLSKKVSTSCASSSGARTTSNGSRANINRPSATAHRAQAIAPLPHASVSSSTPRS